MKGSIFEGAKWSDKFITNTDVKGLYIRGTFEGNGNHIIVLEGGPVQFYDNNGEPIVTYQHNAIAMKIVGRYKEPIDENLLDVIAANSVPKCYNNKVYEGHAYECGFKAGYREGKEG